MDNLKLGEILATEANRDAIHIAVAPVIANEKLMPGEHVAVNNDYAEASDKPIGIVDPFLKQPVKKGQRFYLFLYPGTITSLRHEWIHPAFNGPSPSEPDAKELATARMTVAAAHMGRSLEEMLDDIPAILDGDYLNEGERLRDHWYEIDHDEFWADYETLTGTKVDRDSVGGFTCSC